MQVRDLYGLLTMQEEEKKTYNLSQLNDELSSQPALQLHQYTPVHYATVLKRYTPCDHSSCQIIFYKL